VQEHRPAEPDTAAVPGRARHTDDGVVPARPGRFMRIHDFKGVGNLKCVARRDGELSALAIDLDGGDLIGAL
jgi:hypothetical protein